MEVKFIEIIFENQFTCTKKYYEECYKAFCLKKPSIIILYLIFGLNLISVILDVVLFKVTQLSNYTTILNIFLDIFILSLPIYMYIRNKKLAYERDLERNQGSPIQIKLLISEESINICTMPNKNTSVEFVNIERVIKTKNYYIFISKAKLWVAVKKDSFSKGTLGQFEEFLKEKKFKK